MNAKIKRRWVRALLSGKFKQGKGSLAKVDRRNVLRHCCLGVLCEIAAKDGIVKRNDFNGVIMFDSSETYLPDSVQKWAGLPNNDMGVWSESSHSLADLNDRGSRFTTIAKLIEEHF